MRAKVQKEIWIGLIKVEQSESGGPLGDADYAYTNVVGIARSKQIFRRGVKNYLNELGLKLIRLEAAEPLEQRCQKYTVHRHILKLASSLDTDNPVAFDVFATFDGNKT